MTHLVAQMAKLDHIMYATPDLDQGIAEIAKLTGVTPAIGGSHPGRGTRNALLALGDDQYLEVIAPDPEQDLTGNLGSELIEHGGSGVRGWAVAMDNLVAVSEITGERGLNPQPIIDMDRTTPQGVRLDWQILLLLGDRMLPFFIDWKNSPHPALSTPSGCTLTEFTVNVPQDQQYRSLMEILDIDVQVANGDEKFGALLQTPSGVVELASW